MAVPQSITRLPVKFSVMLVHRKHLADGKLSLPYFPVVMNDKHPGAIMILPSRWWPTWFKELWTM